MKIKLLILLLLNISVGHVFSQSSYLNVSLVSDEMMTATLDNQSFESEGNYAEFDNISEGSYLLTVSKYYVTGQLGTPKALYSNNIKILRGYAVFAAVDEYGNLFMYKIVPYYDKDRFICSVPNRKRCGSKDKVWDKDKNFDKDYDKYRDECKHKIMKETDFDDLLSSIGNRNFESTNIDILKTALDKNTVSAIQVKQILSFFTFESNKLEVAKYAYKHTCDKNNYFKVYDAFNFDSSVSELKEYISKQK